ncbi:hypothetical protein Ancab_005699 [Ancistrocladus abbreviatus]
METMDESQEASVISSAWRPRLSIPPPSAADAVFTETPGTITIVSNLLSDNFPESGGGSGEFRSFSQLLAGAMASPSAGGGSLSFLGESYSGENQGRTGVYAEKGGSPSSCSFSGFKQNRPGNLMLPISPLFGVSPGFSPSAFLNSPGFFSPSLSPFGMSHQQALAQVTAQATLSQVGGHASSSVEASIDQLISGQSSTFTDHHISVKDGTSESENPGHFDKPVAVDKPADDGYNWRKYGQKQVKGSEYPRGYYRCTNPSCSVKKKVERSFDGHITEIIYKGQHNHEPPQQGRRGKDNANLINSLAIGQHGDSQWSNGVVALAHSKLGAHDDSAQATSIQLHGPSDSEESGDAHQRVEEEDDEPNAKKRNIGLGTSEPVLSHKTVTEPKIIVETRSEVDLLDDGYRWRKYGQKVVKGNPNPRSYYKCTTVGCNVRKHIERSSTDAKAVITTYEGKHNHDIPVARSGGSSMNTTQPAKLQDLVNLGGKTQGPAAFLRLKEEKFMS